MAPECGYEGDTRKRIKPLDEAAGAKHRSPFNRNSATTSVIRSAAGKPAAEIRWLEQRRADYIEVSRSSMALNKNQLQ